MKPNKLTRIVHGMKSMIPSEDTAKTIVKFAAGIVFLAFAYSAQAQVAPSLLNEVPKNSIKSPNQISNPIAYLYVDGNLQDWSDLTSFGIDAKDTFGGKNKTDWKSVTFSHNEKALFVAIEKHMESELLYSHAIYLDTDKNKDTGYKVCGIGADHMIQSNKAYIHAGKSEDYLWHPKGEVLTRMEGPVIEMEIPMNFIKKPLEANIVFVADNQAHGGNVVDYYPDQLDPGYPQGPWFSYDFRPKAVKVAPPRDPRAISNTVVDLNIDGDLSEWVSLEHFGEDGNDISDERPYVDWINAWMANDSDNLYIAVNMESRNNLSFAHTIYLDTDQNPNSGFKLYGLGADYLVQKDTLYRYLGNGRVFNWEPVSKIFMSKKETTMEMVIPRMTLNNPFQIRVGFLGDNALFGHKENDWYPNNMNGVLKEGARYFVYYFSGPAPSAQIDLSGIDINQ